MKREGVSYKTNTEFTQLAKAEKIKYLCKTFADVKEEELQDMGVADINRMYLPLVQKHIPEMLKSLFPRIKTDAPREEHGNSNSDPDDDHDPIKAFIGDSYETFDVGAAIVKIDKKKSTTSPIDHVHNVMNGLLEYFMAEIGLSVEKTITSALLELREKSFLIDEDDYPKNWKVSIDDSVKAIINSIASSGAGPSTDASDEIRRLKNKYDDAKDEIYKLRDDLKEAKDDLKEAKDDLKEAKDDMRGVKDELKETKEKLKEAKEKLKVLKNSTPEAADTPQ